MWCWGLMAVWHSGSGSTVTKWHASFPRFLEAGKSRFWKSENPDFWDLEIHKFGVQKIKKIKFPNFKSVLPKMLARSGLVGKKSSRPYLGPSEAIFSMDQKNPKIAKILPIFLGGPMGPIHPVCACAPSGSSRSSSTCQAGPAPTHGG